jgi:hypothetical protein
MDELKKADTALSALLANWGPLTQQGKKEHVREARREVRAAMKRLGSQDEGSNK